MEQRGVEAWRTMSGDWRVDGWWFLVEGGEQTLVLIRQKAR